MDSTAEILISFGLSHTNTDPIYLSRLSSDYEKLIELILETG
jgi:hypothetical protein